ncbi:MAG TPA: energy transducer TonB [Caulobacteraceae bacterium]
MVALAWLLAAAVAGAPAVQKDAPPEWLVKPTEEQIWWAYPPTAGRSLMGGKARIRCRVQTNGLASGCEVLSEDPPGWGFGAAALGMTSLFRFSPRIHGGKPVEDSITTTITFSPGERPSGPPPSAEQLSVARRLVEAMDVPAGFKQGFKAYLSQQFEFDERDQPLSPEERKVAAEALEDVWAQYSERMLGNLADALARRLTREEMEAGIAFEESPTGRKLRAQARLASREAGVLSDPLVEEQKRALRARFCEKLRASPRCFNPDAT